MLRLPSQVKLLQLNCSQCAACHRHRHPVFELTLRFQCAIDGTLNVLCQAINAGVYKVIMTSSYSSFLDGELSLQSQKAS